jgi:excisionase family DNA binding protein
MSFAVELPPSALDALAVKVADRLRSLRPDEPEPWITVKQAAEHLGCKDRRVYDLVNQGRIPHTKDGTRLLFRRSAIDSALESGRMAAT